MFEQELLEMLPAINDRLNKGYDVIVKKMKDGIKIQFYRPRKLHK